mmetsp:Transcript_38947/g.44538  ORF Transcript_38947/g.44538 Transcript_38947/m.44538 type:complete len:86 (+) Transcript_38947:326-583(+)
MFISSSVTKKKEVSSKRVNSRNSKIMNKRKDLQLKYSSNADLFNSASLQFDPLQTSSVHMSTHNRIKLNENKSSSIFSGRNSPIM